MDVTTTRILLDRWGLSDLLRRHLSRSGPIVLATAAQGADVGDLAQVLDLFGKDYLILTYAGGEADLICERPIPADAVRFLDESRMKITDRLAVAAAVIMAVGHIADRHVSSGWVEA